MHTWAALPGLNCLRGTETHQGLLPWSHLRVSQNRAVSWNQGGQGEAERTQTLCQTPGPCVPSCNMGAVPMPCPVAEVALGVQAESTGSGARRPGHTPASSRGLGASPVQPG